MDKDDKVLLIGMIHIPSISTVNLDLQPVIEHVIDEAIKLENLNFDGILVENFNDTPFNKTKIPDVLAIKISLICHELRNSIKIPIGLNLLRNACKQAMIISSITKLDFIRCNVWEGAYVTDQGIIESAASEVMCVKNDLKSSVKVFADILVKHAIPLVHFDPSEMAKNAILRGKADRIIISGVSTGRSPSLQLLKSLNSSGIKPMIGSGMKASNISDFEGKISGAIVGTSIKNDNIVTNPISTDKANEFVTNWNKFFD